MDGRTLVIMRHAKAEQSESKRDFDRLLTDRGRADALAAGAWLADQGITPDVVICSPAARTRGTWHQVAIGFAESAAAPTVTYEADLYEAGLAAALDAVQRADPAARTVLLIGHNPTVSGLSYRLDDSRIRAAGGLRTSGIAVHDVVTAWVDCTTAKLSAEHTPRSGTASAV